MRKRLLGLAAVVGLLCALTACTRASSAVSSETPSLPAQSLAAVPSTSASLAPAAAVSPVATPSATPYPRLPVPPGTPRCHTGQLEVAFIGGGAAAGNVLAVYEMRNRSVAACWVYGYVGFQLLDGNGRPLPETRTWSTESFFGRSDPPTQILLPVGTAPLASRNGAGHAFFNVATDDVVCGSSYMNAIASLEIWPPDEYAALIIPARNSQGSQFVSCGGLVLNPLQIQPQPTTG